MIALMIILTGARAQSHNLFPLAGVIPAIPNYACPEGFELDGKICRRRNVIPATPVYQCPEGFNLSGTTCIKHHVVKATPIYVCEDGAPTLDGKCSKHADVSAGNSNKQTSKADQPEQGL